MSLVLHSEHHGGAETKRLASLKVAAFDLRLLPAYMAFIVNMIRVKLVHLWILREGKLPFELRFLFWK